VRAVVYESTGGPEVLQLRELADPVPGEGEVLVKMAFSGVNPTDWKTRSGATPGPEHSFSYRVPNQDGSGTIVAVGAGVDPGRVGESVYLYEAAWQRQHGTAAELCAISASHAIALPPGASLELGASLGVPYITAHRCLTVGSQRRIESGSLVGTTVLVAGGAGAVGHAAIELARYSGARVIATVSSEDKAALARAAGANEVVNYRSGDAATAIRQLCQGGVDCIVEVAPGANAGLDQAVIGQSGRIAAYASDQPVAEISVRGAMTNNLNYNFVLLYTVPAEAKVAAISDIDGALRAGALRVGEEAGLALHRFSLADTALAHAAVESGVVGKVLITLEA
jgi:NADPH2:quinone reductase